MVESAKHCQENEIDCGCSDRARKMTEKRQFDSLFGGMCRARFSLGKFMIVRAERGSDLIITCCVLGREGLEDFAPSGGGLGLGGGGGGRWGGRDPDVGYVCTKGRIETC